MNGDHDHDPGARFAGPMMVLVVVLWGLGAPVMKLITAPALTATSLRFWMSVPLTWAIVYGTGRVMSRQVLRSTAIAGVLFGLSNVLFFLALQHTSVATLAVIQAMQPGAVLLVAGPLLGERPTRWHVIWTGTGVLGVIVVVLGGDPAVHTEAIGFILGVAATAGLLAYYLINRAVRFTTAVDPFQWMAGVMLFGALAITPAALLTASRSGYRQLDGNDWIYLLILSGILGVGGHTLMSWVHRYIPAARSSLYLLSMNVVAVIVAWPMHDEPITVVQAVGGVTVLGAVAAVITRPASVVVSRAARSVSP